MAQDQALVPSAVSPSLPVARTLSVMHLPITLPVEFVQRASHTATAPAVLRPAPLRA
jgi:hypothetical protein